MSGTHGPSSISLRFAQVEQIKIIKGPYDVENEGSLGGAWTIKSKTNGARGSAAT